jgi:hypothetical protein
MANVSKWLGIFAPETPLRKVCNVQDRNRIANILGDITGVGCRIDKPLNGEGYGWRIIVDGSTDEIPDTGYVGVDRKFAIGNGDNPGTAIQKIAGYPADTAGLANAMFCSWDAHENQVRLHIPVYTVAQKGPPAYILGRTTGNDLVWVPVTDTCDPGEV